jgi:rubrerythrin
MSRSLSAPAFPNSDRCIRRNLAAVLAKITAIATFRRRSSGQIEPGKATAQLLQRETTMENLREAILGKTVKWRKMAEQEDSPALKSVVEFVVHEYLRLASEIQEQTTTEESRRPASA